jgi:hypothetical protein
MVGLLILIVILLLSLMVLNDLIKRRSNLEKIIYRGIFILISMCIVFKPISSVFIT